MENIEIDDSEFYHQDFTTASEWEIFMARIEEILHEWKLTVSFSNVKYPSFSDGIWESESENLFFADVEFTMTHHFLKPLSIDEEPELYDDLENETNYVSKELDFTGQDFPPVQYIDKPGISLARVYGLHNFVVLSPTKNIDIDNESKVKILLSSVHMAVNNSNCELPMFVQVGETWQQCFLGVSESRGLCTNFDMIHLQKGPQHCKYLTGLLDVFKSKIASPIPLDTVTVSVQFSYSLVFMNKFEFRRRETIGVEDIGRLQFGACLDPFNEMLLLASWENLPESVVVDSQNYSDFDPLHAASWAVKIKMVDTPACLLSDCILEFLHLSANNQTLPDLLGDYVTDSNNETVLALNRITESKVPSLTSVLRRAASVGTSQGRKRSRSSDGPLSEEFIVPILYFLFPDAEPEPKRPYIGDFDHPTDSGVLKSCGFDSLVWRLAIILAQSAHSLGGVRTVGHIWYEFVQEMRYRWEKSIKIPGLSPGFPDFRTCLLHQKLQLLNCCIERKLKRENVNFGNLPYTDEQNVSSTDSDDEFFDCDQEEQKQWTEPVGRLSKYGSMKLIKTGEPLYVPITQEAVPKTEDQLEEDADVLVQLGDDAMGSELRARMMSASLLSDMESFKAANPDGLFEDFIRWYSPRDWIDDPTELDEWGQPTGHLSSRMQIEDNTWTVVWQSAKPIPARRQKRLFDDTREAEKVLHYLESRTISQVIDLILPVLTHCALCYLVTETKQNEYVELPQLNTMLRHLVKTSERITRDSRSQPRRYEIVFQEIAAHESLIAKAKSIRQNFYSIDDKRTNEDFVRFFTGLLENKEMIVPGGPREIIGDRITKMFSDVYKHLDYMGVEESGAGDDAASMMSGNVGMSNSPFPTPEKKEYVLRVMANRPSPYSKYSIQFMRAILTKDDFRLAGAFNHDTLFF